MGTKLKKILANPNRFLYACRFVMFFMTFAMLFLIPLSQFLGGCQGPNTVAAYAPVTIAKDSLRPSANTVVQKIRDADVGGIGGELIARQMDLQATALRTVLKGASVERIGQGILITFNLRSFFNDDCFETHGGAKNKLKKMAEVLHSFAYTDILIAVHTDDTAEESYNYLLSEKQANVLLSYLAKQGIESTRLRARGYGETLPATENYSEAGRRANHRLEIAIFASSEARILATKGTLVDYLASKQ